MASRDFPILGESGYFTGSDMDDFDYRNDPEVIIDPISCTIVAVVPRSERQMILDSPPRAHRSKKGPPLWHAILARWLRRAGLTPTEVSCS
jgi:hypothetical protein